ncbi:MAG: trypsin-like peptidase domain-containing protein [Flexistipes sinusarabici]|uniref:Trypsin-like peptidase domain-containing protein n=1 Tax=Flexistipes sinusarabici TaxID=2352 RepID=A0A5D0MYU9_FLESI|nr:serine protease [Flexistipes sinusarabici]TYB37323.1 MAG: trypsin-like peptidase domain-containing protein [Flexistipes sinusarabici]
MFRETFLRYRYGCLKLFAREGDSVVFMGSAFIVHNEGYLVTAAHLLYTQQNLLVITGASGDDFHHVSNEEHTPIPVNVVEIDHDRDLALLKIDTEIKIEMPDHLIGVPENVHIGHYVSCVGYPFGFHHVFNQAIQSAIVSAKMKTKNGTNIFLFNSMIHLGTRGGPLIDVDEGRVIGVVAGQFDPFEASPKFMREEDLPGSSFSYAISIEYVEEMLKEQGVEII